MAGADHMLAQDACSAPVLVMGTHAGWWDPMVAVLLGQLLMPHRRHYAPMDAKPLARYGILQRIGIFPVELASARGAVQFVRAGEAVLRSGGVLWVTPQGRFADVRERPVTFKGGVASLLERVPETVVLPLAIEYTFWDERLPETLIRCGEPTKPAGAADDLNSAMEAALTATMDALRSDAIARDPKRFRVLLEGSRGTGGIYALGRRLSAKVRGRRFPEDHSERDVPGPPESERVN